MSQALNMTQFNLTEITGKVMNVNPNTISARVVSTSAPSAGYLQAGDFVVFHPTEVSQLPVVQQVVSGAICDGVVIFNAKKNQYNALDLMEIALAGSIITVLSGGTFNRGALLNYVPGTTAGALGTVFSTTSNIFVAEAIDISSAAGQVVRVRVRG
jgi:hypothetical protein